MLDRTAFETMFDFKDRGMIAYALGHLYQTATSGETAAYARGLYRRITGASITDLYTREYREGPDDHQT